MLLRSPLGVKKFLSKEVRNKIHQRKHNKEQRLKSGTALFFLALMILMIEKNNDAASYQMSVWR